jgi:hypothetical protein
MKHYNVQIEQSSYSTEIAYVRSTEVAKYVRNILKQAFPNYKFSVRKDTTGTLNVDIKTVLLNGVEQNAWDLDRETYRAIVKEVESKISFLHGEDFDGMIDMRFSHMHYLLPTGEIVYGGTSGTEGSMGCVAARHVPLPEGARKIRLSNDFIFVQR